MQEPEAEVGEYDPHLAEAMREGEADEEVSIIARLAPDAPLPAGVRVVTRFGDIVTLRTPLSAIPGLASSQSVIALEASHSLHPTIDAADISGAEQSGFGDEAADDDASDGAAYVRRLPDLTATGRGTVVAALDWGLDFAHPAFRLEDGRTRLLALWDQRGQAGSGAGNRWGYGRILYPEEIDRALRSDDPYSALSYHPADAARRGSAHGTHVLDIAAGSGRGGGMSGVAPDAALVFVHLDRTTPALSRGNLGDSVTVLEALDFVFTIAGSRPCVVNMSVGAHGGPHDGSTLVEQGIDRAVWLESGRAVLNSAGNYYSGAAHTHARVRQGQESTIRFAVPHRDPTRSEVELWYAGSDRFAVTVIAPDGTELATMEPGDEKAMTLAGQRVGHVYHVRHAGNREHHFDMFLKPRVPGGVWQLRVRGLSVQDGRCHAWIERETGPRPRFIEPGPVRTSTTGTLCNGRLSITVGAYDPRRRDRRMGAFSSAGPTRDGRMKPEIVAPGVRIRAARSTPRGELPQARYTEKSGTSMAAPHVAGAVAVMFEAAGKPLDIADTRALLLGSAERIGLAGPDAHRLGSGYLNTVAAERAVRAWVRGEREGESLMADIEWEPPIEDEAVQDGAAERALRSSLEELTTAAAAADQSESLAEAWGSKPEGPREDVEPESWIESGAPPAIQGHALDDGASLREALWEDARHAGDGETAAALHARAFERLGVGGREALVPLASERGPLLEPVQAGDLLVRTAPGQGVYHSAVVVSGEPETRSALEARGVAVEPGGAGMYVEVIEVPPHAVGARSYGRRLTDARGLLPRHQSVLRAAVLLEPPADLNEQDAGDVEEQVVAGVDWCAMRATIAATARAEEARWTAPNGQKYLESHPSRLPILAQYWATVPGFGTPAAAQNAAQNSANNVAGFEWSAAFICYVMHTAGVRQGHGFEFALRHMNYIVGALRNRERSDANRPFWLVDRIELRAEAQPEPGDLLCFNRVANGVMTTHSYDSLRRRFWLGGNQNAQPFGSSHCSIVVGSTVIGGQRFVERIGGNEAGSVRLQRIPTDRHGGIPNPDAHNLFGMIKLVGC